MLLQTMMPLNHNSIEIANKGGGDQILCKSASESLDCGFDSSADQLKYYRFKVYFRGDFKPRSQSCNGAIHRMYVKESGKKTNVDSGFSLLLTLSCFVRVNVTLIFDKQCSALHGYAGRSGAMLSVYDIHV